MMLPAHSRRQGIQPSSINPSISLSSAFRSNTPDSPAYRSFKSRRRRWHRWLVPVLENWGPNLWSLVRVVVAVALITLVLFRWVWEVQVEFSVYRREWVKKEILSLEHPHIDLAATCFSPQALATAPALSSWNYSLSTGHSPLHVSLQSTLALTHEGDCFAFSDSIRPSPEVAVAKITYYHSYWRADLLPFGARQAWTLKTFLATQPLASSVFVLWSNGDLARNSPALTELIRLYPRNIEIRRVDLNELARGTALEGRADLLGGAGARDHLAWIDGDLVRLLVLWKIGGVWADMDMLFVRDLHVLLEVEWVTQWDCYNKPYQSLNGALLHFHRQSPYLCTLLTLLATSPPPHPASTDWGATLYLKAFRRLLHQGIVPFQVLPWCLADPRNCRTDKRVPDPFKSDPGWWGGSKWSKGGEEQLRRTLDWQRDRGVFTLHLHNQWNKDFPTNGWVRRLLLDPMDAHLETKRRKMAAGRTRWKDDLRGEDWEDSGEMKGSDGGK